MSATRIRAPRKLRLNEIPPALAAHDRAQAASDAIRRPLGLPIVPDNAVVRAWRMRLAGNGKVAKPTADPLDEIRKAVDAKKRADARIIRGLYAAREAGISLAECARQLGMTRQGVHAMLGRGPEDGGK